MNKKKRMTARELIQELAADPEHQRQRADKEREMAARKRSRQRDEEPIVADLIAAGIEVASVWDLVSRDTPPAAVPVLLRHLQGDYDDRNLEGVARALATSRGASGRTRMRRPVTGVNGTATTSLG